jgi:hypothetical protein
VGPTGTGHHLSENTVSDNYIIALWVRKKGKSTRTEKTIQEPQKLKQKARQDSKGGTQLTRNPLEGTFHAEKHTFAAESINSDLSPPKSTQLPQECINRNLSPQKSTQLPLNLLTGNYLHKKSAQLLRNL